VLVALVTIGILLIVFGGLVLLRFPDRPGGVFEFRGVRVQSVGAGLPLIVLGLVAVILAALQGVAKPEQSGSRSTRSSSVSATYTLPPASSAVGVSSATSPGGPGECLEEHLDTEPKVNSAFQTRLPEGETVKLQTMVDSAVILMVGGKTTGAVRFKYAGGVGPSVLTVYDVVDASCRPGTWESAEIHEGFLVTVALPDHRYELTISYPEHPVYPQATFRVVG
jgi:hypothetical protein